MARNYYSEINLHITWHTKESSPLLIPKVEADRPPLPPRPLHQHAGVFIHEIGGIETHVHLCVTICADDSDQRLHRAAEGCLVA